MLLYVDLKYTNSQFRNRNEKYISGMKEAELPWVLERFY
jgi:hypothetical protein